MRDLYNTTIRDQERESSLGAGALFGAHQPALARRINEIAATRARNEAGEAMQHMVPQIFQMGSDMYSNARNQRIGAEMGSLQGVLNGYLGSHYQQQQGGIIPALAGVGAAAAGMGFKPFGGAAAAGAGG